MKRGSEILLPNFFTRIIWLNWNIFYQKSLMLVCTHSDLLSLTFSNKKKCIYFFFQFALLARVYYFLNRVRYSDSRTRGLYCLRILSVSICDKSYFFLMKNNVCKMSDYLNLVKMLDIWNFWSLLFPEERGGGGVKKPGLDFRAHVLLRR